MARNIRTADPYTITENDVDFTASLSVANVDSELANYRAPDRTAIKIKRGSRLYLVIASSTSATGQVTTGQLSIYKASSDKITHKTIVAVGSPDEFDADGTPEDRDKQYRILKDVVLGPKEYILVEINSTHAIIAATTKFRLDCIKAIEWSV